MLKGVIGANKGEKIELLNMKVFNLTLRIDTYMYICIYIKKILLQFYFSGALRTNIFCDKTIL